MSDQGQQAQSTTTTTNMNGNAQQQRTPTDTAPATDTAPKRVVTDVVANDAPTAGMGKPDAFEIVQQQQALLQALQAQLRDAQNENASFKERENLKRKRDEEESAKQEATHFVEEKSKTVAALRAMLEEVASNSRGGLAQEHIDGIGKQTLEKLDSAKNRLELKNIAADAAPFMKFVHAASMDGKRQREEAEQLQLRQTQAALRQMSAELPHTGVQVSGGVHQQLFSTPVQQQQQQHETPDSGNVQASFGRGGGNMFTASRNTSISEVVRGGSAPASSEVAAPAINLEEAGWAGKVQDECLAMHGMLPGEKYLRYGGEEVKTRFNASANRHEITSRKPRRERPLGRPVNMKDSDPKGFNQIVDGINSQKRGGTAVSLISAAPRRTKELSEVHRLGEYEQNGKPKYFEAYRGPLPSDNLMT
jgi:hypothetical protein